MCWADHGEETQVEQPDIDGKEYWHLKREWHTFAFFTTGVEMKNSNGGRLAYNYIIHVVDDSHNLRRSPGNRNGATLLSSDEL